MARVLRSSSWLMAGYAASQLVRLAANLILARLLFPEAFGMMALVNMVIAGLALFSDIGMTAQIAQSKRGDDPEFLNTAWTVQILRGLLLFTVACLLAEPFAAFYGTPELALYLAVAALSLLIGGFFPTRIDTANRHLALGRVTLLDLAAQVIGVATMVLLALATGSVLSLVIGVAVQALARLVLMHLYLPGQRNRLRWHRESLRELVGYGKWIFLSTAFWFLASQSDKAILGKFLFLDTLGLYNVAFFLASFPMLLGQHVTNSMLISVYREKPAHAAPENRRHLNRMRMAITGGLLLLLGLMALIGPWLVGLLYDDRYLLAGPIVTLIACAQLPAVIALTYDRAALAAGDSRSVFVLSACRGVAQVVLLIAGASWFGLIGAIAALGITAVTIYPVVIWLAAKHRVWHPTHDLGSALVALAMTTAALWLHWDSVAALSRVALP